MRTFTSSTVAVAHLERLEGLQQHYASVLQTLSGETMTRSEWFRDEGRHGGGHRLGFADTALFDRATLNISHVHYDDLPDKRLASATALSCIVHPRNPRAPSLHLHTSWTELRDGRGTWRVMADLNPSVQLPEDKAAIDAVLERSDPGGAIAQGEKYFWIPALERHRGVCHFYLEGYKTEDPEADADFALSFEREIIDTYGGILERGTKRPWDRADFETQLGYHTLYLFQVLTLDRGTTSGLLVHAQNDLGILGSLPSHVDRDLLESWAARVPPVQKELVHGLVACLPQGWPAFVSPAVKLEMIAVVRAFYRAHPDALALQARGNVVPPTVANHR